MFRRCCAAPSQMWSAPPTACRRYAAAPVAALRALMKSYVNIGVRVFFTLKVSQHRDREDNSAKKGLTTQHIPGTMFFAGGECGVTDRSMLCVGDRINSVSGTYKKIRGDLNQGQTMPIWFRTPLFCVSGNVIHIVP